MAFWRKPQSDDEVSELRGSQQRLARIQAHIDALHRLSRQGLWGLLVFILISMIAVFLKDFNILSHVSMSMREFLGKPPSPKLINIALAVYSFSALILTLSRLSDRTEVYRGWAHVGYLTGFYIFYLFSNALRVNAMAVLVAGLAILGLEYYSIWSYTSDAIRRERSIMGKLSKSLGNDLDDPSEDHPI
ncbi:MAG: menaquinol oxidoreductase [Desulfuromonas sp.]|nr:MAG: menaquinol oxidoreductase [Desulfuromonas sp.]